MQKLEDSAFVDRMAKEERQHKDTSTKAARVTALSVNIVHFKKTAVEHHKCQICNRPLNQQELQNFLQYQVCCHSITEISIPPGLQSTLGYAQPEKRTTTCEYSSLLISYFLHAAMTHTILHVGRVWELNGLSVGQTLQMCTALLQISGRPQPECL
jgi:hypothetical protein